MLGYSQHNDRFYTLMDARLHRVYVVCVATQTLIVVHDTLYSSRSAYVAIGRWPTISILQPVVSAQLAITPKPLGV